MVEIDSVIADQYSEKVQHMMIGGEYGEKYCNKDW